MCVSVCVPAQKFIVARFQKRRGEEQQGFRSGRSCIDAMVIMRQLKEKMFGIRVKTQTIQKVRLDLNGSSAICNPLCVHSQLFNAYFEVKFK
jgi:hypothetical protein